MLSAWSTVAVFAHFRSLLAETVLRPWDYRRLMRLPDRQFIRGSTRGGGGGVSSLTNRAKSRMRAVSPYTWWDVRSIVCASRRPAADCRLRLHGTSTRRPKTSEDNRQRLCAIYSPLKIHCNFPRMPQWRIAFVKLQLRHPRPSRLR